MRTGQSSVYTQSEHLHFEAQPRTESSARAGSSRLAGSLLRAFAVFAQNATGVQRRFRLQTGIAPGGPASFLPDAALDHVDANVPAYSSVARTIFVAGTTTAIVKVFEIDANGNTIANGLQSSTIVNSDTTAPPPADSIGRHG